ncbi:hypothetical protein CERSUDRAFT_111406 [Gelatoporia subvermispora B]|uniref:Uncharacterized protein n=1 Tax=Ceriporiopsis subvermispora (strain B) TaxID=914234 RepID=M2PVM6_CERS8|nr:hypothetical protein CERSUDRAFT_111406 [Gelatoporia subvermispora B]
MGPATLMPLLAAISATFTVAVGAHEPVLQVQEPAQVSYNAVKVPVILGVMSRCPDAHLCETVFDQVLQKVSGKVDLSLSFIGTINASEPDFGVTCMHGAEECAGNVQELCAMKYTSQNEWWEFVQCQNFHGRDNVGLPETALKCANTAKIDWEGSGVGNCTGVDGSGKAEEGVKLLQESVKTSQAIGIKKSCTIIINGKQVCIHDGTWKDCENGHTVSDFVKQIEEEYQKLNGDDMEA